ncbi:unnamed protein product [Paramecium primaurelia]|uniref:Transmembrane protein n=1 Tax=Paramecium primaurelia TaxID=5886 RepID=A0A8S1M881_PARPR|nr:unnamed protein product [Paramecium primaurelia]
MKKISNQLKNVDFFSVTYSPAISDGLNYNHSSVIGGIISMIIGALSLIYCIYYMYMWWSYQLLPKVTEDINNFQEDTDFGFINNRMQVIAYDNNGLSQINPFKSDEIILMPLIIDLDVGNFEPLISNITDEQLLDINIKMGKEKQFIIIFTLCKEEFLIGDYKCASEDVQQNYFSQSGNMLYTNIEFTTINPSTFEPQQFLRTYPIYVHSDAELCSQITLHYQLNHYQINKAFLLSNDIEEYNYISNSLNYPQFGTKSYCDKTFLPNTYGVYWILFQQQYRTIQIGYPSISEVFAAIGSIISILFSVKYLITILNLSQMRQSVLDDIMRQYYPEIRRFNIIKNFWGKIQSVKFDGLQVELPSFLAFQKQIHSQMACKLNYKNLLYEMSRFQFIIMSIKRRKEIEKVHNIGIKVPMRLSDSGESYVISEGIQNQQKTLNFRHMNTLSTKYDILSINDALILSQDYKKCMQQPETQIGLTTNNVENGNDNEENEREQDFYDINYVKQQELQIKNNHNDEQ